MRVEISTYDENGELVVFSFVRTGGTASFFLQERQILSLELHSLDESLRQAGQFVSSGTSTAPFLKLFPDLFSRRIESNILRGFALTNRYLKYGNIAFEDYANHLIYIEETFEKYLFDSSLIDWHAGKGAQPVMYYLSKSRTQTDMSNINELFLNGYLYKLSLRATSNGHALTLENYFVPLDPPDRPSFRQSNLFFPWVRILNDMGNELEKLNKGNRP